jgi:CBS domain-containing protein
VRALMTPAERLITCSPTDTVDRITAVMTDRRVRHLPVLEGGRLAGIISIGDVVKARIEEVEREAEEMRAYIATA